MKFDEDLASVHAYLCSDGYVIKSRNTKYKYFNIGFRNTNLVLLKDFQKRFNNYFKIRPHLIEGQRCRIGSKEIYHRLTKEFGSFYSAEWKMPKLNEKLSKIWLRTFFDCEGWVFCKSHQNRQIGLDSINEIGLKQIISALNGLGIKTIKKENKKREIYRIFIYSKNNLKLFKEKIGFLHPNKKEKLDRALEDFIDYNWNVNEKNLKGIIKEKIRVKKPRYLRIISKENDNLKEIEKLLKKIYDIDCIVYERFNGLGNRYYELNINRRLEIEKLIKNKLIPNLLNQNQYGIQRNSEEDKKK